MLESPVSPPAVEEIPPTSGTPVDETNLEGAENPILALGPAKASEIKGDHQCQPGDKYKATVDLTVQTVGDDGSLTFEVPQITDFTPTEDAGGFDEEPPAPTSENFDRYSGPTKLGGVAKSLEM